MVGVRVRDSVGGMKSSHDPIVALKSVSLAPVVPGGGLLTTPSLTLPSLTARSSQKVGEEGVGPHIV